MLTTVTYKFLGIPLWSVTRETTVADEEVVYKRMAKRFEDELNAALERQRK